MKNNTTIIFLFSLFSIKPNKIKVIKPNYKYKYVFDIFLVPFQLKQDFDLIKLF
jgi:hypothetical protein